MKMPGDVHELLSLLLNKRLSSEVDETDRQRCYCNGTIAMVCYGLGGSKLLLKCLLACVREVTHFLMQSIHLIMLFLKELEFSFIPHQSLFVVADCF